MPLIGIALSFQNSELNFVHAVPHSGRQTCVLPAADHLMKLIQYRPSVFVFCFENIEDSTLKT